MKTRWMHVIAGLTVFALCFSLATPVEAAEVWSDDFDDGNYDGWTVFAYVNDTTTETKAANFSATNGMLEVLDDDINVARIDSTTSVGTWTFDMFVPDTDYGNVEVMFLSNGTRPFMTFSSMMVSWEAWMTQDRFDLWELRGNREGLLLDRYAPVSGIQGWYHIDVSRSSSGRFLVYVNDTLRIDLVSNDVTSSTYFEFWGVNATGAAIDNIVVDDEPLPNPPAPTPTTTTTPPPAALPWDLIAIGGGVAVVVIVLAVVCLRRR